MPRSKRILTWAGILFQGYAFYVALDAVIGVAPDVAGRETSLLMSVWLLYAPGRGADERQC